MEDGVRPEPVHEPSTQAVQVYSLGEQTELLDELLGSGWLVRMRDRRGKDLSCWERCVRGVRVGAVKGRKVEGWEAVGGGPGGHVTRQSAVAD